MPKRNTYHNRGGSVWFKTLDKLMKEKPIITTKERQTRKEEPKQRMEKFSTSPKNTYTEDRPR